MSEDSGAHPPNWYPDPYGRHEYRYWDGSAWTEHVSSHGRSTVDPPLMPGHVPAGEHHAAQVQRQVQTQAGVAPAQQGGGHLLAEPVLVVNQKAKVFEMESEFAIYDQHGRQIGAVRQVGQSAAKKAARLLTSLDNFMTHKFQIVDVAGNVVLQITRPAKVMKSTLHIQDGTGAQIGSVVQKKLIGKINFDLVAGGQVVGAITGENWRAWNFAVRDASGAEIGRITKTWSGLAKTMFTSADNYVVQIHRPLPEPLRSITVASSLCVDTALKQQGGGFN